MKAVVAAFNQEKALVGAFSVITNLRMELFQALATTATHLLNSFNSLSDEQDNGASSVAAVGRLINIFKQRGCLPMAGTSRVRVDTNRSDVSINCWDTSFITFYTSSLYLHFLQYANDRRQNIIKCCLDHKTSVRARRRLFIIVYKYFIPSAMILSNIKYLFLQSSTSYQFENKHVGLVVVVGSCGDQIRLDNLVPGPLQPPLLSSAQGWNPEILCKFYFIVTPRQQLGPHNGAEAQLSGEWSRYCDQNYFRCQMTARAPQFWLLSECHYTFMWR